MDTGLPNFQVMKSIAACTSFSSVGRGAAAVIVEFVCVKSGILSLVIAGIVASFLSRRGATLHGLLSFPLVDVERLAGGCSNILDLRRLNL